MTWNYGETVVPVRSVGGIYVEEGSLADRIGMQTGDQVIGVNGEEVEYFNQLFSPSAITDRDLSYLVNRNGETVTISTPPNFLDLINEEGRFIDETNSLPSTISRVLPDSPASNAGLQDGDKVVEINGNPVSYWLQLVNIIQNTDESIELTVQRESGLATVEVTPDPETQTIGIQSPNPTDIFEVNRRSYNLAQSAVIGVTKTSDTFTGIIKGIGRMFSGDISVRDNLGGPVAIASITKEATDAGGWIGFWNITAFLSVTLAIMNMLPIPALDGGHFMFLVYEGITRREPSPKVRMGLQQLGFIFLIGLFILVTFNDILRTFGG
jgi:regulator of sigma E protease